MKTKMQNVIMTYYDNKRTERDNQKPVAECRHQMET